MWSKGTKEALVIHNASVSKQQGATKCSSSYERKKPKTRIKRSTRVSTEVKDDLLGSLDERIRRISREVLVEHQAREQQPENSSIADSEDEKPARVNDFETPTDRNLV
jgi:hypothetical protein